MVPYLGNLLTALNSNHVTFLVAFQSEIHISKSNSDLFLLLSWTFYFLPTSVIMHLSCILRTSHQPLPCQPILPGSLHQALLLPSLRLLSRCPFKPLLPRPSNRSYFIRSTWMLGYLPPSQALSQLQSTSILFTSNLSPISLIQNAPPWSHPVSSRFIILDGTQSQWIVRFLSHFPLA